MQPHLEPQSAPARAERDVLDEALFCLDRSFDPADLPVYLPPVPRVISPVSMPVHTFVPEYLSAPLPEFDYPLPSCPEPDETPDERCAAVSDAGGSYQLTNLGPGLYEVRQPAPPEQPVTPVPPLVEPTPDPPMPERLDLRVQINTGLSLEPGEKARIGADVLRIGVAVSPFLVDLMLLSPPVFGVLLRDGFALTGGDVFTQEDIDQGRISYRHEGETAEGADFFSFATPEGEIQPTRVEIQIAVRRRPPRLLGAGRIGRIAKGMAISAILDGQTEATDECGIAVVGVGGSGTWAYSIDEGRTWRALSSIEATSALLLGPDDLLRFVPRPGHTTVARLTYRAWDLSSHEPGGRVDLEKRGVIGGSTAFSQEVTSATLKLESMLAPVKRPVSEPWKGPFSGADLIDGAIAIVRIAGEGTWQFSVDGTKWRDCKSVYHGRALLLRPSDRLRFVPRPEATGKVALSLRSWDGNEGETGSRANLAAHASVGDGTGFGETIESWTWSRDGE